MSVDMLINDVKLIVLNLLHGLDVDDKVSKTF